MSSVRILARFPMDRWAVMKGFLAASYRPNIALVDPRFFAWYFRAGDGYADVATAWDGERLVGMMGYLADPMFWGAAGQAIDGAWLVNWTVDPAYRHGIGVALMLEMTRRFQVVLGIDALDANIRVVERLGWSIFQRIPRYVAIFDSGAAATLALANVSTADLGEARYPNSFCDPSTARPWPSSDIEPNWERYPALAFGTVRSASYLRWRYTDHPTFRFEIVSTGSIKEPAIAAYRIETVAGTSIRAGRVIEFFHSETDSGRAAGGALARALASRFAAAGCAFGDFVATSAVFGATFEEAGWAAERPEWPLLPMRLQPPERTPYFLNVEYGVRRALARPSVDKLHVTRGDGDADRPVTC